jgi:two-component system response regulator VanR
MDLKYLAVDSNIELAYSEAEAWKTERGIGMDRVDTMTEAINMLMSNDYLYIGVNGDVTDFMPLLRTMRSVTNTPILIATTNFTTDMEVAALNDGADLFASYHKNSAGNIASVLAHIAKIIERSKMPRPKTDVKIFRDLLIAPSSHQAFVKDKPISLTKIERSILCILIENRDSVISNKKILREVWGKEYQGHNELLWQRMHGLRKKLSAVSPEYDYIKVERTEGYRLS